MNIHRVTLQNFVSWKEKHSFDLGNQGLVFMTGPNGAGKSSIFDAIVWALFGRTSKPLLAEDVVNIEAGRNCYVSLECTHRGKPIIITRYRKHAQRKNDLELEGYGGNLSTVPAVQAAITKLVGCGYERFIQTLFFSQGDRRYFTQLGEAQQREVIGEVYDFNKFKEARRNASREISALAHKAEEIRLAQAHSKGVYEGLVKQHHQTKARLDEVRRLQTESKEILQQQIDLMEVQIKEAQEKYEKALFDKNEITFLKEKQERLESEYRYVSSQLNSLRETKTCPTCGQDMKNAEQLINELSERKNALHLEVSQTAEKINYDAYDRLCDIEKGSKFFIAVTRSEITKCQFKIRAMASDEDNLRMTLRGIVKEAKEVKAAFKATQRELHVVQKEVQCYEYWEEGFGSKGIEVLALTQVLPIFNERVNSYLSFLPTYKGIIEVDFQMEKGHLVPNILYEGSNKYAGASGGEKRRIDLCVSLALSDLCPFNSNVLLLDEVFDGIEPSAFPDVLKLLQSLKFESVFVSSHNVELRSLFPSVWMIGIEEGKSKLLQISKTGAQVL